MGNERIAITFRIGFTLLSATVAQSTVLIKQAKNGDNAELYSDVLWQLA